MKPTTRHTTWCGFFLQSNHQKADDQEGGVREQGVQRQRRPLVHAPKQVARGQQQWPDDRGTADSPEQQIGRTARGRGSRHRATAGCLEKALVGKVQGDSMEVKVEPAEGYGDMVPELVQ